MEERNLLFTLKLVEKESNQENQEIQEQVQERNFDPPSQNQGEVQNTESEYLSDVSFATTSLSTYSPEPSRSTSPNLRHIKRKGSEANKLEKEKKFKRHTYN